MRSYLEGIFIGKKGKENEAEDKDKELSFRAPFQSPKSATSSIEGRRGAIVDLEGPIKELDKKDFEELNALLEKILKIEALKTWPLWGYATDFIKMKRMKQSKVSVEELIRNVASIGSMLESSSPYQCAINYARLAEMILKSSEKVALEKASKYLQKAYVILEKLNKASKSEGVKVSYASCAWSMVEVCLKLAEQSEMEKSDLLEYMEAVFEYGKKAAEVAAEIPKLRENFLHYKDFIAENVFNYPILRKKWGEVLEGLEKSSPASFLPLSRIPISRTTSEDRIVKLTADNDEISAADLAKCIQAAKDCWEKGEYKLSHDAYRKALIILLEKDEELKGQALDFISLLCWDKYNLLDKPIKITVKKKEEILMEEKEEKPKSFMDKIIEERKSESEEKSYNSMSR